MSAASCGPFGYFSALKAIAFDYPVTNSIVSNIWGYNAGYLARAMFFSAMAWKYLLAVVAARWPHAVSAIASSSRPLNEQRAAGSSGVASQRIPCESYCPQTLNYRSNSNMLSFGVNAHS